jgi:hypothetical protein
MTNESIIPVHPKYAANQKCTLTSRKKVLDCLVAAISARYNQPVDEKTKLGSGGLGLDATMIRTDLYATVVIAVHHAGCQLRSFGPDDIAQCKTVGDVADGVWKDLIAA